MVLIRRAGTEDCEGIWRAHIAAIEGSAASHYSPEVIRIWVGRTKPEKYLNAIENLDFFVAEEGELIIGFAVMNLQDKEVQGLYVDPNFGRRGLGLKLMQTLENRACESGLESLQLFSSLNAVAFYERLGYEAREHLIHKLNDKVERACVRMEKKLQSM